MRRKRKATAGQSQAKAAPRKRRRAAKVSTGTGEDISITPSNVPAPGTQPNSIPQNTADTAAKQDEEVGTGRSYFESHRGVVRTTNLTLASLNIAPTARLEAALANLKDPLEEEQQRLADQMRNRFRQFEYMLSADHSLLFYGYGSKRILLDDLAEFLTCSRSVVVVNGFNPTVSLRSVFAQIASDVLHLTRYPKRTLIDYVEAIRKGIKRQEVAVVVHNIDGAAFRSLEAQHALSMLATVDGVSLIASIDHVNAPLLWDGATYSRYDWAWIKADTFRAYTAETVFCSKPLLRGGTERRIEGAVALLKSLSERARDLFRELARRQSGSDQASEGEPSNTPRITFNQLFETAKAKFLASDPATMRIILTELETHDLLQRRRGADMAEQLWIPLEAAHLEEVLQQIDLSA